MYAGEEMPSVGELVVPKWTKEHTVRSMKLQAATVTRPQECVQRICEAGQNVVFDQACSVVFKKETGEMNHLREDPST